MIGPSLLIWALVAMDPYSLVVSIPARYETEEECEIGRAQWEQQHLAVTWCQRGR